MVSLRLTQKVMEHQPDGRRNVERRRRQWEGKSLRRKRLIKASLEVDNDYDDDGY
jgi:hypothetical protein